MDKGKSKGKMKVKKAMDESKLHSGSKSGPLVKSKDQDIAIGMSEAGLSKHKKGK